LGWIGWVGWFELGLGLGWVGLGWVGKFFCINHLNLVILRREQNKYIINRTSSPSDIGMKFKKVWSEPVIARLPNPPNESPKLSDTRKQEESQNK